MDHAISLHFFKDLSPEEKHWDQQSKHLPLFPEATSELLQQGAAAAA